MGKKILFAVGEGIGNVIQTIPTIRTLKESLGYSVDVWHAFGSFPIRHNIVPYVDNWFHGVDINKTSANLYDGVVSTIWTKNHINIGPLSRLPLLNDIKALSMHRSEVDTYMDMARDVGVSEEDILWWGECEYIIRDNITFDIIIHNGYNIRSPNKNWQFKSYTRYPEVVKILIDNGLTVGSVGDKKEYIKGTVDLTGLSLLETFGHIKQSNLFLGNDSGLYHATNALGVPNVVIFTYTSTDKNYDKRFHKHTTIIGRDDLECRWCQGTHRFKVCEHRSCIDIDPQQVANAVMEKIKEK